MSRAWAMRCTTAVPRWRRDCWCVAFGNSYNDEERCVLAGYDNGDVKMFDLRMNKVRASPPLTLRPASPAHTHTALA